MYDRRTHSRRTNYEQSRPAPRALASLTVAALLLATLAVLLAAPVPTATALVATTLALRAVRVLRRRSPRKLARATALRVEPLLSAAFRR